MDNLQFLHITDKTKLCVLISYYACHNLIIIMWTLEKRKQLDDEQIVIYINEGKPFIIQLS